jgi:hypothetical protein
MKLVIIQSPPTILAPLSRYKYFSQHSIFENNQSIFLHQCERKLIVSYILTIMFLQIEEEIEIF